MTPRPTELLRHLLAACLIPLFLALWGCGSEPRKEPPPVAPSVTVTEPEPRGISLDLPPTDHGELFNRATQALAAFDWMAAESALDQLPASALTTTDADYASYLRARIAFTRGDLTSAMTALRGLDRPDTYPALGYRAINFRRHIESLADNTINSASLGQTLLAVAPDSEQAALKREIWRDLQRAGNDELAAALSNQTDPVRRGWLELATLAREGHSALFEVGRWRDSNALHPAAQPLPGGMDLLLDNFQRPQRVVLLLPLSGRLAAAGKAVRDGYLANYYAARSAQLADFELQVIDQDRYPSVDEAYDDAVLSGAGLVVGPLSKQAVATLARRPDRSVPVLALNRGGATNPGIGAPLVQLSLSPEDEAERLAEFAFGRGARRALVIKPATKWGEKVDRALVERWQELGGSVANRATYGSREEHSGNVKQALDIPSSESRARGVRDMLATNIEFTARRRQDVDVVFLLAANGVDARSLKPLLAFHYAGSIPVYSTSSIYSGVPDSRDRDLDGVSLVEMPWLLGGNPSLRVAIAAGDTGGLYTRLNALGADAFVLQQNFGALQAGPDALIRGNTGLLAMDPRQRMIRDPSLATFDGGELEPR